MLLSLVNKCQNNMLDKIEVATKVVVINRNKKILILKRNSSDDYASWEYDLPWWRLNIWENPVKWIERELFEETWLMWKFFVPISTWSFNKENTQIIWITYMSFLYEQNYSIKLSDEHFLFKWISKEDIKESIFPKWLSDTLYLAFNFFEKINFSD